MVRIEFVPAPGNTLMRIGFALCEADDLLRIEFAGETAQTEYIKYFESLAFENKNILLRFYFICQRKNKIIIIKQEVGC